MLGLSNTAGVLAGVLGTAATGYILQHGKCSSYLLVSKMSIVTIPSLSFYMKDRRLSIVYVVHNLSLSSTLTFSNMVMC